jgi:uncharacterized membrane protein
MEYLALVLLHVTFGVIWAGGAIVVGLFVVPSVVDAGPQGGAVMAGLVRRRMPTVLTTAAVLTVLTGARILWIRASVEWLQTSEGIVIAIGAASALEAFIIGVFVQRPTAGRLGALGAAIAASGLPPTPDQREQLKALQAKLRTSAWLTAWSLIVATVLMASHRMFAMF